MQHTPYNCFGWVVLHFQLLDGDKYDIVVRGSIPRAAMSAKTFYTVGYISAKHEDYGVDTLDRPAGFFSPTDLPETLPRGKTTLTAKGNCEWWCVEGKVPGNNNTTPILTKVLLNQGQTMVLPVGTHMLVCEGTATIGNKEFPKATAFTVTGDEKTLTANTNFSGLIFDRVNTL